MSLSSFLPNTGPCHTVAYPAALSSPKQWKELTSGKPCSVLGLPPQVSLLGLPDILPGEGPSLRPSLEHTGLTQFPRPTESL